MANAMLALLWAALTIYTSALPQDSASNTPSTGYIDVSVATLWTDPSKPRAIDAPALQTPAQIQQWLDSMTTAEYLDLTDSDRTQTQALYGTQVHILNSTNDWYEIYCTAGWGYYTFAQTNDGSFIFLFAFYFRY